MSESEVTHMKDRFRGFLPVVVDIETGGFNCQTDAILEIAMTTLTMDDAGLLTIDETHSRNVEPLKARISTLRHLNSPASIPRVLCAARYLKTSHWESYSQSFAKR